MERLTKRKNNGINGNALRTWGLVFLAAGVIGRGVLQAHLLGIGKLSGQQLLDVMGASSEAMAFVTASLVMQAIETCAVPVFAFLLVQGVVHTSDFKAYLTRVAGLALLTEIPYNLAMNAKLFAFSSRNPVFGLLLCMVMLWFFRRYSAKGIQNTLIKIAVTAAAMVWANMLKIDNGASLVLTVAVLWAFRGNPLYRNIAGAVATILCCAISPFFLAAPMGFMVLHFYNDEKGTTSRRINYLAYPVILVAAAAVGMLLSL